MSSIPHPRADQQTPPPARRALALARQLTPLQRHLVVRAGLARWLRLPHPFQPAPGRQAAATRALSSPEFGLVAPTPGYLGAYQLTALGELVAGILLLPAIELP